MKSAQHKLASSPTTLSAISAGSVKGREEAGQAGLSLDPHYEFHPVSDVSLASVALFPIYAGRTTGTNGLRLPLFLRGPRGLQLACRAASLHRAARLSSTYGACVCLCCRPTSPPASAVNRYIFTGHTRAPIIDASYLCARRGARLVRSDPYLARSVSMDKDDISC